MSSLVGLTNIEVSLHPDDHWLIQLLAYLVCVSFISFHSIIHVNGQRFALCGSFFIFGCLGYCWSFVFGTTLCVHQSIDIL
jgi:hypothetical protein